MFAIGRALRKRQIDPDCMFAEFCSALLGDEPKAENILRSGVNLEHRSVRFGALMFEFCIRRGSINMIRLMLEQRPALIPEKNKYIIFAIAAERSESAREAAGFLLKHSEALHYPKKRRKLLGFLAWRAGEYGHLAVVEGILDGLDEHWRPESSNSIHEQRFPEVLYTRHENAKAWFSHSQYRKWLLQRTYANLFRAKPYLCMPGGSNPAGVRNWPHPKPDIGLLHLLLANGVDVDNDFATSGYLGWLPPLFMYVSRGFTDWAETIIQAGAKIWLSGGANLHDFAKQAGIFDELTIAIERCDYFVITLDTQTWIADKLPVIDPEVTDEREKGWVIWRSRPTHYFSWAADCECSHRYCRDARARKALELVTTTADV